MRYYSTLLLFIFFNLGLNAQIFHVTEDFNVSSLPTGWTNTALSGAENWNFGSISSNTINGNAMAFFNDDSLGASSTNNTASLTSPSFDNIADSITFLEFDYNFRNFNGITDSFLVEVFDGTNWNQVFSRTFNDCGNWTAFACSNGFPHASIDISAYKNSNCRVRFIYHDGSDWGWYVGIDNVEIYPFLNNDLSINQINSQSFNCLSSDSLRTTITNNGLFDQSNFSIGFKLNNQSPVFATFNDTLAFGESLIYTFPNKVQFLAGANQIEVFTSLTSDQNTANDTVKKTINSIGSLLLPFFDGFEGSVQYWRIDGLNPSWQIGQPSGQIINQAFSGSSVAATNLNGNYSPNELAYLNSPCFDIDSINNPLLLSFGLFYEANFRDSLWLEYSIDGGYSYKKVYSHPSYIDQNWYPFTSGQYWSMSSNNQWIEYKTIIDSLNNASSITFRFVFKSNSSIQTEGFAIDNFLIEEQPDVDLKVNMVELAPNNDTFWCDAKDRVKMYLSNLGTNPVDTFYVDYLFNDSISYRDTLIGRLEVNQRKAFESNLEYDFTQLNQNYLRIVITAYNDQIQSNDTAYSDTLSFPKIRQFAIPYLNGVDPYVFNNYRGQKADDEWISYTDSLNYNSGYRWQKVSNSRMHRSYAIRASSTNGSSRVANYVSPCILLDTSMGNIDPYISFLHRRSGTQTNFNPLIIDVYDGVRWTTIDSIDNLNNYPDFSSSKISLANFSGKKIRVRFKAEEGGQSPYTTSTALDLIGIYSDSNAFNLENVPSIGLGRLQGFRNQYRDSIEILMEVNNASDSLILPNQIALNYTISGLDSNQFFKQSNLEFNRDTIKPLRSYFHTFKEKTLPSNAGNYNIVTNIVSSNQFPEDDTSSYYFSKSASVLPYFEDFEEPIVDRFRIGFCNLFERSFKYDYNFNSGYGERVLDSNQCTNIPYSGAYNSALLSLHSAIELPSLDLKGYSNVDLEFYYQINCSNPNARFYIKVNQFDSIPPYNLISTDVIDSIMPAQFQNNLTAPYLKKTTSLNNYLGKKIRVSLANSLHFYNCGDSFIDDIKIYEPLSTDIDEAQTRIHTHTLSVYPNPNNGAFTIEVPEELIGERYEIIDISGKLLISRTFRRSSEPIQIESDKGVYILSVPTRGIYQKVVIY